MYSKAKLKIGIDTIVFVVDDNIMNEATYTKLNKKFNIRYECNEWIITNDKGSSICTIGNYIFKNKIKTKVNLYGISQIYGDQKEHNQLMKWIYSLNQYIIIDSIDISLDHYSDYYKTIVSYNNRTNIDEQHNRAISYITKFNIREFYIPNSNQSIINKIINKLKIKDEVNRKSSYYQPVYQNIGDQYTTYSKTQKEDSTHTKFNIKSAKEYTQLYNIIESEDINTTYSKRSFSDDQIIIVNKSNSKIKIINYDKTERDNKSQIKSQFILNEYSKIANENNVKINKIKHNRTEVTFKKLSLDIQDGTTSTTLMSKIKDEIDKLRIVIFKTKKERIKYQLASKRNRKLQNYEASELKINDDDIVKLIDIKITEHYQIAQQMKKLSGPDLLVLKAKKSQAKNNKVKEIKNKRIHTQHNSNFNVIDKILKARLINKNIAI